MLVFTSLDLIDSYIKVLPSYLESGILS